MSNYGVAFLTSLYPGTAVLQQCQLSHHTCADKELICLAPAPNLHSCTLLSSLLWAVASAESGSQG